MGQGGSAGAREAAPEAEEWRRAEENPANEEQTGRAGNGVVKTEMSPRGKLVYEFRGLLKNFEARIANPNDLEMVGNAYRSILDWSKEHDLEFLDWACRYPKNPIVLEVFDSLEPDPMYPAWRRQALDEAYMLLFEDIAKQGDPIALDVLPEPHIPQETGYRTLPSPLVKATSNFQKGAKANNIYGASVRSAQEFATGTCYCQSKRAEYEIRTGPPVYYDIDRQKSVCGREIVAHGSTERQCCLDPVTALVNSIVPQGCCGRPGSNWSSLLGYGGEQKSIQSIPEDAPVFPQPTHFAAAESAQPQEPIPQQGSSLNTLSRAKRDELLQPSVGKEWWA